MRTKSAMIVMGLVTAVLLLGSGCSRHDSHGRANAIPIQYLAQVDFGNDGTTCSQTIRVGGVQQPQVYVDMSASNGDTIVWRGSGAQPILVKFPDTAGDRGEGTPFHQGGQPVFTFDTGTKSSAASLDGRQTDFLYTFESVTVNGQKCNLPVGGMGVHVSK